MTNLSLFNYGYTFGLPTTYNSCTEKVNIGATEEEIEIFFKEAKAELNVDLPNDYENILHKYQMEIYDELIEKSNKKKIVQFVVMWIQKYPKGLKEDCMNTFKTTFGERENDIKLVSGIFDSVLRKYYSQIQ